MPEIPESPGHGAPSRDKAPLSPCVYKETVCTGCSQANSVLVFRVSTLKTEFLPLLSVSFVSENSVVAAVSPPPKCLLPCLDTYCSPADGCCFQGHDCCPMLFNYDDRGSLTFVSKLDIPKQSIQRNLSAMERFRNMDKRATTEDRNTALDTLHQNSITWVLGLPS